MAIAAHVDGVRRDDRAAVEKALSIMEAVGKGPDRAVGLSEVARRTGLAKSTAFRLMGILERSGAVARVGNEYRIGPLVERWSQAPTLPVHDAIRDVITPAMVRLYEETHDTVHLAVLSGTDVVYLNKLPGHRRLDSPSRIGGRLPAYATGVGKALLARDPDAVDATMGSVRRALTDRTIVDADALTNELTMIRETGVAFDRGEAMDSVVCVAAPIIGPHGRVVAAISVSGPRGVFRPETHATAVRRASFAAAHAVASIARTAITPSDRRVA
jgi:DNA-binding IclR family transcriptional regulator